jgi:hypothetical protein
MSNTITTPEMERNEAFRNIMRNQKCPFRLKTKVDATGTTYQYMMECDPDCAALIHTHDKHAYSCLRLMNVNYTIPGGKSLEIFSSGLPKEED